MNQIHKITIGLLATALLIAGCWGYKQHVEETFANLYADKVQNINDDTSAKIDDFLAQIKENENEPFFGYGSPVSDFAVTLTSSVDEDDTTLNVSSITTTDNTALTSAIIYPGLYLTIDPGGADKEIIFCEDISGTSFTNCVRGLSFSATTTMNTKYATNTAYKVTANAKDHPAGTDIIASNPYQFYEQMFMDKWTNELVYGMKTFASNTIAIGDDDATSDIDKCFYLENGATDRPYICYDESENYWIISSDGTSSFQLTPTSTVIAAGKNLDLTAGIMDMQTSVYIPDLNASSTIISDGASIFGFWGPEGNLNSSGTLLIDGIATFGGFSTSTFDGLTIGGSTAGDAFFSALNASTTVMFSESATTSYIYPWATNTYDLGGSGDEWRSIYSSGTAYLNDLTVSGTVITGLFASSTLQVTGVTTLYDDLTLYGTGSDLIVQGTGTSTFAGGVSLMQIDATGSATSTFANGIDLADGCYAIDGSCVTSGNTPTWEYISQAAVTGLDGSYGFITVPAGTKAIKIRAGYNTDSRISAGVSEIVIKGENEGWFASSSIQDGENNNFIVDFQWNPNDATKFTVFGSSVGGSTEQHAVTTTFYK
jgi:hypothetical protein